MTTLAREAMIVAIDFESTGSVPGYPDEPWQLGLAVLRQGEIAPAESREWLLKVSAERPFNPNAPGSWRAVRDRLSDASTLPDLWPHLKDRLAGYPLIAHNAATEKKFLRQAWPLHRPGPWIDTLTLVRLALPGLTDYRLEQVVRAAGLEDLVRQLAPGRAPHDALYDAVACAAILSYLLKQPGWERVTVEELTRAS